MRLIPYRDREFGLGTFQNRMNRLFDSFLGESDIMPTTEQLWPAIDVIDTPETLQIKAELPGIDPKDIDVSIAGNALTIKGAKLSEKEEKGKTWYRRERSSGSFVRSIPLPVDVDAEHVEAINESGVLTITLPKLEPEKAKFIPVRVK